MQFETIVHQELFFKEKALLVYLAKQTVVSERYLQSPSNIFTPSRCIYMKSRLSIIVFHALEMVVLKTRSVCLKFVCTYV